MPREIAIGAANELQRQKILLNETNSEWRPIISPPIVKCEEWRKRPDEVAMSVYSRCEISIGSMPVKLFQRSPPSTLLRVQTVKIHLRRTYRLRIRVKNVVGEKSRLEAPVRKHVPEKYIDA